MKKLIKLYSNINITLGVILIVAPMIALFAETVLLSNTNTVSASAGTEKEIIKKNLFSKDSYANIVNDNKFTSFDNSQNSQITVAKDYTVNVPGNGVTNFGNRVIVPSLGIDTLIQESWDADAALNQGVWRMPAYGYPLSNPMSRAPIDPRESMILAAHRWGDDNLSTEYRTRNLFLNLPNLKAGDEVFIMWDGKEHKYIVNHVEENVFVSRLEDLILYTCKYYNSEERIFVYAEKVY